MGHRSKIDPARTAWLRLAKTATSRDIRVQRLCRHRNPRIRLIGFQLLAFELDARVSGHFLLRRDALLAG
jgi:hypothetical protein